ncbi:MAG: DUF998 domain-containing protein [Actinomycetota bacterium]|nr:DUF998 domain-containing protein [Actinomycetota bacterium]
MKQRQALAWGGVVGPTGFVVAWATAGALTEGYSPVQASISRLATVQAPTRWLMTAGFVCFGVAVLGYSVVLRDSLGGRAWLAATVTGLGTLGAGAFPLEASSTIDRVHVGFATVASVALVLTPVLAAQPLSAHGHFRAAAASRLVGVLSGACLAATAFVPAEGLMQRIGLTLADGWLAASAVAIVRGMKPLRVPPRKQRGRRRLGS